MNHLEWISINYSTIQDTLGKCQEACLAIKKEFPELRITNGFVTLCLINKPVTHWWCVDLEGNIVDPTAKQYDWNGTPILDYEEIPDNHPERLYKKQKCMNCGEYYYITPDLKIMHTQKCELEFMRYLNGNDAE